MSTTTYTPTCRSMSQGVGRWSSRDCGRPAVAAVAAPPWATDKYDPICRVHLAGLRRRRYATVQAVEITPEMLAGWEQADQERRAVDAARTKEKAEQHALQVEASRQIAIEQHAIEPTWERSDEQGDLDWEATTAGNLVYAPPKPHWISKRVDGYGENAVTLEQRTGWPPAIDLSISGRLTVNEARALAEMLVSAVDAATHAEGER